MRRALLLFVLSVIFAFPASAQEPEIPLKKLNVRPAPEPVPAFRYRLLPEARELQPGNALICYLRANTPEFRPGNLNSEQQQQFDALMEMSFDEFKAAKKPDFQLRQIGFHELDSAARREFCDWEMLARIRKDGLQAHVGDVQRLREAAYMLAYRARLDLANSDIDKTVYTLQTMLGMSRHIADAPTLIHELVAMAVAAMALGQVEDLIQQPDAPNLYWALTALPKPFVDLRKALEGEQVMLEAEFPELKKIDKEALSPEELKSLTEKCCFIFYSRQNFRAKPGSRLSKLELVGQLVQYYPAARKALIEQGRAAEKVDALSMLQVVVWHNYQQYLRLQDDQRKWALVPIWQGLNGFNEVENEVGKHPFFPFHYFVSGVRRVREASDRIDRRIAVLRCIEALRLHVAQSGKLPASLDEVTLVPVPPDPYTGRPFQYTAADGVIKLYAPPPPGRIANEATVVNYQITINR
jgi:hypothetical protein